MNSRDCGLCMDSRAARCRSRISSRRLPTWDSRVRRAVCSRRKRVTSVLYCSIETPWYSVSEVADGTGRRVREFIVSGRIVLVLEGRADRLGRGLGDSSRSLGESRPLVLRVREEKEPDEGGCLGRDDLSELELSEPLVCMRAMANSRSISFTSSVVKRCSRETLSSCCIVLTRLARFGGILACSARSSTPIKDGAADTRVTLVTVVPEEGRTDCPLLELSSNCGDLESGTEVGPGAEVGAGQDANLSGIWSAIRFKASALLDSRFESKLCLRSGT